MSDAETQRGSSWQPGRAEKGLVGALLTLLLVPGIVGFDAWPLTAWRLFSLARTDRQTHWVLEASGPELEPTPVALEELPMRYLLAEWPVASASAARHLEICEDLLDAVASVHPGADRLRILRDSQRLVERGGQWVTVHSPQERSSCGTGSASGATEAAP